MTYPDPFQIGRAVGENFAPSIEQQVDTSAIDNILREASGKSPEDIENLIGQIVSRVSPQNQKAAMQLLQNKQQKLQEKSEQNIYTEMANDLERQFPDNPYQQTVANVLRQNLPFDQKEKLLKSVFSVIPSQQKRLQEDLIRKKYDNAIKDLSDEINATFGKQKKVLEEERNRLRKERNEVLNIGQKSKESKEEKVQFDLNNSDHLKILEEADVKFKGNKEKIEEFLSERFTF